MRAKTLVLAAAFVLAFVSIALAGFCPRCHKQIPDDQKYCADCTARMQAEQILNQSEKALVDDLTEKREKYRNGLDILRKFYIQRGNAAGQEKVDSELHDFSISRKYRYQNWEDVLPLNLNPTDDIREANLLYREAERLRTSVISLVIGREEKLREAADPYRSIIDKYPTSNLVDDAAFHLGEIYEELGGPDTLRAARFYVLCFLWNPKTQFPAQYRAARVYDLKLRMYDWAAWLYKLASTDSPDPGVRKNAAIRFEQLSKRGYKGEPPAEILTTPTGELTEAPGVEKREAPKAGATPAEAKGGAKTP